VPAEKKAAAIVVAAVAAKEDALAVVSPTISSSVSLFASPLSSLVALNAHYLPLSYLFLSMYAYDTHMHIHRQICRLLLH
jgi:hypothetical protein